MIEIIAQIFGTALVGMIVICLIWTIGNYISEVFSSNNKLEENMKKWSSKDNK